MRALDPERGSSKGMRWKSVLAVGVGLALLLSSVSFVGVVSFADIIEIESTHWAERDQTVSPLPMFGTFAALVAVLLPALFVPILWVETPRVPLSRALSWSRARVAGGGVSKGVFCGSGR